MNLFYTPHINISDKEIVFNKEESNHIAKVLRRKEGSELYITNGVGALFIAELTLVNPKNCIAKILSAEEKETFNYQLHLAVAPTKNNDRFEWFLEKATEIGVTKITPIICDYSERKTLKIDRFERIIESAMKQSLKFYKPQLHKPVTFLEFINNNSIANSKKCIANCYETPKISLKKILKPNENVTIMIGPEGDFSENEVIMATKKGFQEISLGESRLRTETAAIVACHSVSFINYV